MPWGAAIAAGAAIGGSLLSADAQKDAAKKSSKASQQAASDAQAATEQNYQRTQTNLQPYIGAGSDALTKINAVNNGDYSGFENSPDYQFSLNQGLQGLDRGAASRGSLYSGGHSADVLKFASGLADQNLNTYYNRLTGLATMGQGASTNLGSIGNGAAGQIGNFGLAGASAVGQGAYDSANANSNLYSGLAGLAGQVAGAYGTSSPTASSYGTPAAQTNAGLLGGANYTGPGSTSTNWSANWNV